MDKAVVVHDAQRLGHLDDDGARVQLCERAAVGDLGEQLATLHPKT